MSGARWTTRWSRRLVFLSLSALLVSTLAAAPAAAATFRIAIGVDPDSLDPVQTTTTTVANVIDYVAETLTRLDDKGKIVPSLAESWSISSDGTEYTFKIRQGVTFHDGTALDAKAVKWNLDRLMDPKVRVPQRSFYPIEKVEVVDPRTVKVTLQHPYAPFIGALSWTTSGILSPASVQKHGNSYENYTHIVGTGPYAFEERRKGASITMTRYDRYWGEKPYYDTVLFRIVPEAATRESLLLAGQVDLIILPPVVDLPALQRNPAVKVLLAPGDRTIFIAINNRKPILKDRRVRQALNYAVDKTAIVENVLFGTVDPMDAPMAPSLFGHCKVGSYDFDPQKAKDLLAQAGVEPGTRIQLIHPTGRYIQDKEAAQAIAGYLREVGLEVELRTMDWPSYIGTITAPPDKNTTEMHLLGWAPPVLDAAMQMTAQFNSNEHPPKGLATSFYSDSEADKLLEAAERETSPEKREELYCRASKRIWEDAPWIFLWVQRFPIVYSAKVAGVSSIPNEKFYAVYARPAQ